MKEFTEQNLKTSKLLIILSAAIALTLSATLIVLLSKSLTKKKELQPLSKTPAHETQAVTYSDCICLEKSIPQMLSGPNRYFSVEPLQRTISYP